MAVPFTHYFYAHCSLCGNFELQTISRAYVKGYFSFFGRFLHLPSLRCDRCRHKFFSIRPMRRLPAEIIPHSTD